MKILVTGAAGQIATELLDALAAEHDVVACDVRLPECETRPGVSWRRLDITHPDRVADTVAEVRPDVVYHLAAILSARGERDPVRTYQVNQQGTYYLLEACRQHDVGQVLFTSSIAVYGPGVPDPTPEDVALHPTTMYGVSKVGGELLAEYYRGRYGLDIRGIRFPGLISATLPGGGTSDYALYMYTDGIGKGRYEAFCRPDTRIPLMYMPDGVHALLDLARAPRARLGRCIYNVAGFSPTAAEIAESVIRAVGDVIITFAPDPARQAILDSWPHSLCDDAARADWGWRAAYDLESMTAELVPKIQTLIAETRDPGQELGPDALADGGRHPPDPR